MPFSQEKSKYHKAIPFHPKKICKTLPEYLIFQGALSLSSRLQSTSTPHGKRQIFNRASNFVSVPRLCNIWKVSNSQAKTHFTTPFLQNRLQWLLSNVTYLFLKGKIRNIFSYVLCSMIESL